MARRLRLILKKYPELKDCTEFNILGHWKKLDNIQNSINNWKIRHSNTINNPHIDEFVKKVSTNVESNPYEEIRGILITEYSADSPNSVITEWLGKLYGAISDESIRIVYSDIRDKLRLFKSEKKRQAQKLSFYLWSVDDLPPDTVQREENLRKACIAGETPRKSHLIEGCFASRGVYGDIYQKFCSWLENVNKKPKSKLPVFWISGRSGSGKSVALLHLLSMIKSNDREAVIAWFSDKPESLGAFLPYMDELSERHEKIYLSFDDPYVYQRQEIFNEKINLLHDQVERLYEKHPDISAPFIVCCGPDEQLDWCEENLIDFIDISKYRLRDENYNDTEEVREWFEKRTGLKVPESDAFVEKLLVQTVFEWSRKESLQDFAVHFKKRLSDDRWDYKDVSLFDLVSKVLAVNRLYALFPTKMVDQFRLVDAKLAKAFYQLEKEDHHLTLILDDDGVKLTHPHLADILYREWYGKNSDSQLRKNHLIDWISFVENESRSVKSSLSPYWVIAKLSNPNFKSEGVLVQRIDLIFDDLKEILPSFYARHIKEPALSHLPVWTDINYNFQLQLNPDPLEMIGRNLKPDNIEETGFRLSCHKVIEFYDITNVSTRQNLQRVLRTCRNWHGWGYVFFDYVRKLGVNEIEDIIIELIEEDVTHLALIKISHYFCNVSLKVDKKIQRVMSLWFEVCPVSVPSWVANFTDFSQRYGINPQVKIKAELFLKNNYDHKSWSYVWEVLWRSESENDELAQLARSWLRLKIGKDGGWSFVWEKLALAIPRNSELIELAHEYLNGDDSLKSKKCVWSILREQEVDNLRLEKLAKNWLLETPVHYREWIYLWGEVVENFDTDKEIITLGIEWLYQASVYHPTWVYALTTVRKNLPLKKRLKEKIIVWLEFNSTEDKSWQYLWEEVYKDDSKNTLLIKLGMRWLKNTSLQHEAWAKIWEVFWDKRLFKDEVRVLGLNWLSKADFGDYRWQYVWKRLYIDNSTNDSLRALAYKWLEGVEAKHHSWVHVWVHMWKIEEDKKRLRAIALIWLNVVPKDRKGVRDIQIELNSPVSLSDKLNALQSKYNENKK